MTRSFPAPRPSAAARMLLARHRPVLAGSAATVAVLAALPVLAPAPGPTVPVLTAAADLRWGTPLSADDVVLTRLPPDAAPAGALTALDEIRGRLLASPVRRGEPLTDLRLVGPALLSDPGTVAVGVRLADAGVAALLQAGSIVDVLAAQSDDAFDRPAGTGSAEVVANAVRVLAVPDDTRSTLDRTSDGALVLVAATEAQASRLAAAQATGRLSVALRSR